MRISVAWVPSGNAGRRESEGGGGRGRLRARRKSLVLGGLLGSLFSTLLFYVFLMISGDFFNDFCDVFRCCFLDIFWVIF